MDTVTINITETPNDVTINVTVGGGGMQCADLAACQTIIDILADITAQQTALNLKIQSVTGPNVDNTDPFNPIVNPLGLIKIIDLNGELFTDLATASAWIEQFFTDPSIITDKSFNNGVFYFTVPNLTVMDLADGFLNTNSASFIDSFGLIIEFQGGSVFYQNNAKQIFKDIFFNVAEAFTDSELDCECNDFNMDGGCAFASNTTGTFKIKGLIDPASASSGFFSASTATILASAKLYTSNAGVIDASLEQAILNGCNVQFDGINLEKVSNKSTSIVTDQASNIKYPSVKSVYDWVTTSNGYYNVKDYGAIGDGTTDDTTAILAAISASYIATGNVNLYFPNAVYKVNSQIEIDYPTAQVNIVGNGSTLKSGLTVAATAMLKVSSCSFLDIDNLKFNFNANVVAQYGLIIGSYANSKRVGVARISICDFYNFGVENQRGMLVENTPFTSGLTNRNTLPSIIITRCNFYNLATFEITAINYSTATLYGIGIELGENSDNAMITDCNFNWIRIGVFSTAGANATIANNNFICCMPKLSGSYAYGAIYIPNTGGNNGKINIIGNKINHNFGYSIYWKYATAERPLTISGNQFIANCTSVIYMTHTGAVSTQSIIQNNYFERASQAFTLSLTNQPFGATLQPFIYLSNQLNVSVKNNKFLNDATYAIVSVNSSDYITAQLNQISNTTGTYSLVGSNNILETGTDKIVFSNAPTLVNPVVGTQSANDNSTKAASTAYADAIIPSQTSNSGKFLTTNGTVTSWGTLAGGGDLLAANNLSDVANVLTARNNLKMYDMYITTGDQTTTLNTSTDITGLVTTTLTANKRYYFDGYIHIGCSSTGGVKFQVTLPTGATVNLSLFGLSSGSTAFIDSRLSAGSTLSGALCTVNNALGTVRVVGEVQMSSTAGVVQFGFASGTGTQTSTIYQLGTNITYKQLD